MNRKINKVAVLGSGIMGSRIACHFANCGMEVLLLDMVPKELNDIEKQKGWTIDHPAFRNRIVLSSLDTALKSNPSPIYRKSFASKIHTGNFTDHMKDIVSCDWIIEVVIENLEIKKKIFTEVEKYRTPGTLITSNTSGIPIRMMTEGRSEDFNKHFCGTHFFNPPRYLPLLELIPNPSTDPEVLEFLAQFGEKHLGKTTVVCKDTPAFIANRIGVYSIMALFHLVKEKGYSIEEVEKLTGPLIGRPKSATFRTCDLVGLDTLAVVAKGVHDHCPQDESLSLFAVPDFIEKMLANKWLGDKTKQGFFKKTKNEKGEREILSLDLNSLEYQPRKKVKFASIDAVKNIDNLRERMKILFSAKDRAGEFYRASLLPLFAYVSNRIPEISNELFRIDDAMRAGFGWELGPFETWDAIGIKESIALMNETGIKCAPWISEMEKAGFSTFYKLENGVKKYYDPNTKSYKPIPGSESFIILENLSDKIVWKNAGSTLKDVGDGILNLEFHTKMNTIGSEVVEGVNKSIELVEQSHRGLVISNEGLNFSVGANLALVFMYASEQDFDEIDFAVRAFQNMNMKIKLASIPVVVAPHGLTLGGGCEMCMHAPMVTAAAETYIGLVEFGVGLIPGGGGTKEMAIRISDSFSEGDIQTASLREKFLTIAMAKVATSGYEAFDNFIFREGHDRVVLSRRRLLREAKEEALKMANAGYIAKSMRKDIKVLGRSGLGLIYAGANAMFAGKYVSEHDKLISQKLGHILCGGDLSGQTLVSEQYLLDLEREAFVSLCGQKKTLERIQAMLTTGKALRN